jgi:hypothetical protein
MTYEQFIEELRELITEGEAWLGIASAGTPEFREWRHRAESVVVGIQTEGFVVPGGFHSPRRLYQPNWAPSKPEQKRATFDRDLRDSLAELRYIIRDFEKYGPRRLGQQAAVAAPAPMTTASLSAPEKVTLRWMYDHVPVRLWLGGIALLLTVFFIGFAVGQVPAVRAVVCSIKPDACPTASAIVREAASKAATNVKP